MIHSIAWPTYQSYDAHAVPSTPRVQLVTHLVSLVIQAINRLTFSPIGSILFVISTIGNSTVLYLLTKRRLRGPLRIDIMLMHLAIADLMVTFLLMPLEIAWAWTVQWRSTDLMCRLMSFFRVFGLYLSSFVMVCISLDRWVALCR